MTAPTPMMAVVLACVVDTGIPNSELKSRDTEAARSAEKPWYFSSFTISMPTDLMIFLPPIEVPSPMTREQRSMSQTGICTAMPSLGLWPFTRSMPQQDNAHEFLSVLSSVHEAHTGRAEYLGALKEAFCLGPFRLAEHGDDQLAHQITQAEAHDYGDDKSIEDLHPFSRIHAA